MKLRACPNLGLPLLSLLLPPPSSPLPSMSLKRPDGSSGFHVRPVPAPLSPQSSKRRPGETRVAGGECDSIPAGPASRLFFIFGRGWGCDFGVVGFRSGGILEW